MIQHITASTLLVDLVLFFLSPNLLFLDLVHLQSVRRLHQFSTFNIVAISLFSMFFTTTSEDVVMDDVEVAFKIRLSFSTLFLYSFLYAAITVC